MKNIRLFVLLYSVLLIYPTITITKAPKHTFIKLEHPALHIIDGETPGMNSNSVLDCLKVRNVVNTLLHGEADKATHTYQKKYNVNSQLVALNDLVRLEETYNTKNMTFDPTLRQEFNLVLNKMKQEFMNFTRPLLGQAAAARRTNLHLIQEWCAKTNRPHSLLLNWGAIEEEAALLRASAIEFKQFCNDLKDFLHDLMYSCPKGRQLFKEHHLPHSEWEKFDASFRG